MASALLGTLLVLVERSLTLPPHSFTVVEPVLSQLQQLFFALVDSLYWDVVSVGKSIRLEKRVLK